MMIALRDKFRIAPLHSEALRAPVERSERSEG